jgi:hypothetical protein
MFYIVYIGNINGYKYWVFVPIRRNIKHWCTSLVLDIDGDGIISRVDMDSVLDLMTDNAMDDELKDRIINGVGG